MSERHATHLCAGRHTGASPLQSLDHTALHTQTPPPLAPPLPPHPRRRRASADAHRQRGVDRPAVVGLPTACAATSPKLLSQTGLSLGQTFASTRSRAGALVHAMSIPRRARDRRRRPTASPISPVAAPPSPASAAASVPGRHMYATHTSPVTQGWLASQCPAGIASTSTAASATEPKRRHHASITAGLRWSSPNGLAAIVTVCSSWLAPWMTTTPATMAATAAPAVIDAGSTVGVHPARVAVVGIGTVGEDARRSRRGRRWQHRWRCPRRSASTRRPGGCSCSGGEPCRS